jgi:acyl carrier protein
MTIRKITKTISEKLAAFGFDTPESIEGMSSVSYLAIIVELEDAFGITVPDEILAENAFRDMDTLAKTVQSLLPKGSLGMFRNIRIVSKKKYIPEDVKLTAEEANRLLIYKRSRAYYPMNILYLTVSAILTFLIYDWVSVRLAGASLTNTLYAFTAIPKELLAIGFLTLITIVCSAVVIIAHELLHLITYPGDNKSATLDIIISLPFSITLKYNGRRTKKNLIFSNLCPIITLSIVTLGFAVLVKNPWIECILLVIFVENFIGSTSDVVNAIFISIKIPKNSMTCGSYVLLPSTAQNAE